MPREHINRHHRAVGAIALVLLGGLLLAACGGGGSKSTTSTASASAGASGRSGGAARSAALRTCLKKEGITLPERKPGSGPGAQPGGQPGGQPRGPFGSGTSGGGFQLPKGVTREKMQAALKKCGAGSLGFRRRSNGTRDPQQLAKFAACMRSAGVSLPAPNTSGKGPVFNTKGIDTTSSTFKQADAKCAKGLRPSGPPAGTSG